MRRLSSIIVLLAITAGTCVAQSSDASNSVDNAGDDQMAAMLAAGFRALGYSDSETAERIEIIHARASNQVLDTLLRSAAIAGGWVTGFEMYSKEQMASLVHIPASLTAEGFQSAYLVNGDVSEIRPGMFVATILNRPLPDVYKFVLRTRDGAPLGNVLAVRRFTVADGSGSGNYFAYEVMIDIDRFDAERMYLDIAYAGR